MVNTQKIRVFFLGMVYFVLLTAIFLPHHHHEEIACYTATHCEEAVAGHDHHDGEDQADHHHDHETPEEPQRCLTSEYYVFSDSGKNIKRIFDLELVVPGHHHFLLSCMLCAEEEQEIQLNYKRFSLLTTQNRFTVFVKHQLPMRAPPAAIV